MGGAPRPNRALEPAPIGRRCCSRYAQQSKVLPRCRAWAGGGDRAHGGGMSRVIELGLGVKLAFEAVTIARAVSGSCDARAWTRDARAWCTNRASKGGPCRSSAVPASMARRCRRPYAPPTTVRSIVSANHRAHRTAIAPPRRGQSRQRTAHHRRQHTLSPSLPQLVGSRCHPAISRDASWRARGEAVTAARPLNDAHQ